MSDSTAFIDATSFTYIDDSTSTISAAEAATAQSMVNNFDKVIGPLETQSKTVEGMFNNIIDDILAIKPWQITPEGFLNDFTSQALQESFASTEWMMGADALNKAESVMSSCEISTSGLPNMGDLARKVESIRSGVTTKAAEAVDKVAESVKAQTGAAIAELVPAKKLSQLTNPGRSKIDKPKKSSDAATSTVSSVIDVAKGGMAKGQSILSKVSGPLKKLDSLMNCASSVGGQDFAGPVDNMIDKTQNLYDKMYLHSDPASPKFGYFDQDAFANAIPGVSPSLIKNVFKLTNMQNQVENNANLVTDKLVSRAKPSGIKSTSSLDPSGETQSIEDKQKAVKEQIPVVVSKPKVPAANGRKAEPAVKEAAPKPTKVITYIPQNPTLPEEEKISIKDMVAGWAFLNNDGTYTSLDSQFSMKPKYFTALYSALPDTKSEKVNTKISLVLKVENITITKKSKKLASGTYYYWAMRIGFIGLTIGINPPGKAITYAFVDEDLISTRPKPPVLEEYFKPMTADVSRNLISKMIVAIIPFLMKGVTGKPEWEQIFG